MTETVSSFSELVFVKLGGSLITDKTAEAQARPEVIERLAEEVSQACAARPAMRLVLGHGSGSFGHVAAQRFHVHHGCSDWRGYAETGAAAQRLNRIVTDILLSKGVPVVSLQPSASAHARAGDLVEMDSAIVEALLLRGLVPLVYGDVAFDEAQGSAILSTEAIFAFLASRLRPQRILLVGEVAGVFTTDPRHSSSAALIRTIHAAGSDEIGLLGGSHGVDVTGGMRSKVSLMRRLVRALPGLRVCILSGSQPGLLASALLDASLNPGTCFAD